MLISVCQGSSADAVRLSLALKYKFQTSFRWRARMLFGCFRRLFAFVRFVTCYLFRTLQRVRFLPSFAVIVCAWVRLCALARCFWLFICRLRGFYCFCSTLPACTLSRVYVACIAAAFCLCNIKVFLCSLHSESQRAEGQRITAGVQAPRLRGCVL